LTKNDSPELPSAPRIEGWTARFIGSEPRLSEVAEMYREIGYEVRLEPFDGSACDGCCKECFSGALFPAMVVYVKNN